MLEAVKTKTTQEILGEGPARGILEEIFADLHPGLVDGSNDVASIFTRQSAEEFLGQLTDFESLLSEQDEFRDTIEKLQGQIDEAEGMRDELLAQVFEKIRPIERSYREMALFFENSKTADGKTRKPVDLFVFNADTSAMEDVFALGVAAVEVDPRQKRRSLEVLAYVYEVSGRPEEAARTRESLEKIQ